MATRASWPGTIKKTGNASGQNPLYFEFRTDREGYHQISAKILQGSQSPARAFIKVEYAAPMVSDKF